MDGHACGGATWHFLGWRSQNYSSATVIWDKLAWQSCGVMRFWLMFCFLFQIFFCRILSATNLFHALAETVTNSATWLPICACAETKRLNLL
jgi:hypothetical protein